MRLKRLVLQQLRNLAPLEMEPDPGINLFYGDNASGKTSLLEAIYILSRGKSFRTHSLGNVVQKGGAGFTLFGQLAGSEQSTLPLGVELHQQRLKMRAKGETVRKASQLAGYLPVVIIHQESHRLLTEGPKFRRQFMDWGLFHVEQSFHPAWRRYTRALSQRNSSLQHRASAGDIQVWDKELDEMARLIHGLRNAFLEDLEPVFQHYIEQLLPQLGTLSMAYQPGWAVEKPLLEVLAEGLTQDRARGYTCRGPHRADLVMKIDGVPLRERVSRGQQKLLVCALYLAQASAYNQRSGNACILLVDDVAAELDRHHRNQFLALLRKLDVQVFLTATEPLTELETEMVQKRFHVEHGAVDVVL
ncbi:MAG: DNA replication/repair protein RecF [Gammaproteobacteria bacterium]